MEVLPLDLLAYICLKLPARAALYLSTTSKAMHEALALNELWRAMSVRDFLNFLGELDRASTADWKAAYVKM